MYFKKFSRCAGNLFIVILSTQRIPGDDLVENRCFSGVKLANFCGFSDFDRGTMREKMSIFFRGEDEEVSKKTWTQRHFGKRSNSSAVSKSFLWVLSVWSTLGWIYIGKIGQRLRIFRFWSGDDARENGDFQREKQRLQGYKNFINITFLNIANVDDIESLWHVAKEAGALYGKWNMYWIY